MAGSLEKVDRNEQIVADVNRLKAQDIKKSAEKVADKYDITPRRVYAILKNYKLREEREQ